MALEKGKGKFREIDYVESSHADPRFEAGDETGLNWVRVGCHFVYRFERRSVDVAWGAQNNSEELKMN
jgi:hypothetical protein